MSHPDPQAQATPADAAPCSTEPGRPAAEGVNGGVASTDWPWPPGPQRPAPVHTTATRRIQSRLEHMELEHLREHAAELAARIESLERQLYNAESQADYWNRSYMDLAESFDNAANDARAIGLTKDGELLVVRTSVAPTDHQLGAF